MTSSDQIEAGDSAGDARSSSFWPRVSRLLPYWLVVVAFCWSISIIHAWNSDEAYDSIQAKIVDPVSPCVYS